MRVLCCWPPGFCRFLRRSRWVAPPWPPRRCSARYAAGVQRIVDRRFNRARYDANQAIAAFASQLQDAVDLDSVREHLAGAVRQALEPAHVSVWMSERG